MWTFLKNKSKLLTAILIILSISKVLVKAGVTVEVKLIHFKNDEARLYGGGYCEGLGGTCDTYFKLCVRLTSTNNVISGFSNCDYKKDRSNDIEKNNIYFQTDNTGISRTITIKKNQWNGYIAIYMEVKDDDYLIDDRIDTFQYTHVYTASPNRTHAVSPQTIYGQRPNFKTLLYFEVYVYCDMHYYGSKCDKYCKYKDDTLGHYKCNSSGERECLPNWYNLPDCLTNCITHDDNTNGHYICATNGSRICRKNWYSLPECKIYCRPQNNSLSGHYNCSALGQKLCHIGWYGDNCTIFCLPRNDDVHGHFNCSTKGKKLCHAGWYRDDCTIFCLPHNDDINGHYNCSDTGTKICYENWYGPNCNTFCKMSTNSTTGFYNCSDNGKKVCASNYYGQNCTVYCLVPENSTEHVTCDRKTGAEVCQAGFTGVFCNITMIATSSPIIPEMFTSFTASKSFTAIPSTILASSIDANSGTNSVFTVRGRTSTHILPSKTHLPLTTTLSSSTSVFTISTQSRRYSSPLTTSSVFSSSSQPIHARTATNRLQSRTVASSDYTTQTFSSWTVALSSTSLISTKTAAMNSISSYLPTRTKILEETSRVTTLTIDPSKTRSPKTTLLPTNSTKKSSTVPAAKKSSNDKTGDMEWLLETKEGKTVLVGSLFALLMLIALVVAVVMYLRSPKGEAVASKERKFKHLEEPPEEWKEETSEKSFFNPLYKVPVEVLTGQSKKKKKGKLEKFYMKKDEKEMPKSGDANGIVNMTYEGNMEDTIINPLYAIRSQGLSKETEF